MMWKPGSDRPKAKTDSKSSKALLSANVIPVSSGKAPPAKSASVDDKRATSKAALSQKTLAMKFMQRKKQSETQKREAQQAQRKQDTWSTVQALDPAEDNDRIVCTRDVSDPSLPMIFGRRSFGGFNKGVEEEYRDAERELRIAASNEKELREEISAEEMATRMMKYTGLVRGVHNASMRNKKRPRK